GVAGPGESDEWASGAGDARGDDVPAEAVRYPIEHAHQTGAVAVGRGTDAAGASPLVVHRKEVGAGAPEAVGDGVDLVEVDAVLLGEPAARDGIEGAQRGAGRPAGGAVDQGICPRLVEFQGLDRKRRPDVVDGDFN